MSHVNFWDNFANGFSAGMMDSAFLNFRMPYFTMPPIFPMNMPLFPTTFTFDTPMFNTNFFNTNFSNNNIWNSSLFGNCNFTFDIGDTFVRQSSLTSSSSSKTKSSSGSEARSSGSSGSGVERRVDNRCGLTAEQLNKSLKGVLAGKGQKFLDAEAKYGVNAAFMVAICNLESGNGTSNAARERNNVAGILPNGAKDFDSVEECIDYLGNILANGQYYFTKGKKTIAQIGPTYCPSDSLWASSVSACWDTVLRNA